MKSVHITHPAFSATTACGRPSRSLVVTFGGPVVTCLTCRRVMLRLIGGGK